VRRFILKFNSFDFEAEYCSYNNGKVPHDTAGRASKTLASMVFGWEDVQPRYLCQMDHGSTSPTPSDQQVVVFILRDSHESVRIHKLC
jgi:hypothetical protein